MATITDSWSDIKTSIINGTFSYAIGDTKQFTYGDGTTNHTVEAEVVYIKSNEKYVDFVLKNFDEKTTFEYQTGAVRSVSNSIPKERLDNIYADELPSDLKKAIIPVKKKYGYRIGQTSNYETLVLYLWLLNGYNVGFSGYSDENDGYKYTNITKIKKYQPDDVESSWWITSYSGNYKMTINENGNTFYSNRDEPNGLVFGFRIGKEPNTRDLLGEQETLDALVARDLTEFVENDITSIRSYAFYSNSKIESVVLPNLETANDYAFYKCSSLRNIYLPNVTSIGVREFSGSTMEEINLPNLQSIDGNYPFDDCINLVRIIMGTNITDKMVTKYTSYIQSPNNIGRAIIYVPDNLVEIYRNDTTYNWYKLESRIYGISDLYKYEWINKEITDSWATICNKIENGQDDYKLGQYKSLDLGTEGTVDMQIVAINADEKSNTSDKVKYTWIAKNLLANTHRMNPALSGTTEGTGAMGGWGKSEMRVYLNTTIWTLFPSELQAVIKEVKKCSFYYDANTQATVDVTNDKLWIPSEREIFNDSVAETTGNSYTTLFYSDDSRKRTINNLNASWFTRSAFDTSRFRMVTTSGSTGYNFASENNGVILCFCT